MDKCAACGGSLELGFIPDVGTAQSWLAIWVAGTPSTDKSFWERLRTGGGVSLEDVEAKVIDAKRCTSCGRLELFATRAPEPGTTLVR
ncbi:MAG TPA: hypothetical protein VM869_25765 [Enhygromyxa sp.]|nr:hypothetical protein [Enhygromyxa sp.]